MQDLEHVAEKQFRAECSRITLVREGAKPLHLEGPGSLSQDATGRLCFELRPDAKSHRALLDDYNRGAAVGQIIPESDYFEITAHESGGFAPWCGKVAYVDMRTGLMSGGVVFGSPDGLSREHFPATTPPEREGVTLYLEGPISFPIHDKTITDVQRGGKTVLSRQHWDHTRFQIDHEEFSLVDCGSYTLLECLLEPGGIGRYRHVRMLEALQFALGQTMHPSAIFLNSAAGRRATIRSFARAEQKGAGVRPPLAFSMGPGPSAVFGIVEAYYRRVLEWTDADWHTVTRRGYQLIQAGGSPVEIMALAYSVATEGAIGDCFSALAQSSPEFAAEIDRLIGLMPGLNASPATTQRLVGSLRAMKHTRNSDRLRAFIAQCGLPPAVLEAWTRTRNSAAHGVDTPRFDAQARLNDLLRILHLFYSIVLTFVRYSGPRTDYLTSGHPEQHWPSENSPGT
ncbi:MAG: hypothetical protein Q8N18_18515 [Opitutaceae bacterium]|nr:hypothetical protein [Opitutaceae bacterium]